MPKSCAAPECKRTEGARESYYKFPLHDKVRLKQWLTNMDVENFFPTKNQYLCSKHFKPSCFQARWGLRYLKHDAVPTVFPAKGISNRNHATQPRTSTSLQNLNREVCIPTVSSLGLGELQPLSETLTIALDPTFSTTQMTIDGTEVMVTDPSALAIPTTVVGAVSLVPLVRFVESFDGLSLALNPSQGFTSVALPIAVTGQQQTHEIPLVEAITIISEEDIASTALQHGFYGRQVLETVANEGPTFIEVSEAADSGAMVVENLAIEPFFEAGLPTPEPVTLSPEEVISYLETMQTATVVPAVEAGPLPPLLSSPETVLSASITRPIPSTVPIVSKRSEEVPAPCMAAEPIWSACSQEAGGFSETLMTDELTSVGVNLQNKVRALQKRPQKPCSELGVTIGVVEQLKKEQGELVCLNKSMLLEQFGRTSGVRARKRLS
ncbi:uncharacterized protein [Hyperolius riggenbachi]|uniref:uncharacterized protein n=1 Tax=Hyperolius riggenbachi TaxID=752182 RepID=UPI0035A268CA